MSLRSRPNTEGSQGRTLEVGTEAQTVEKHHLLASFQGSLSLLIYPRTSCAGMTPPPAWAGPSHINYQLIQYPTDLPPGQPQTQFLS